MVDIKSLNKAELEEEFKNIGLPKFRAGQVYDWMHVKLARSFDDMTNISKDLRAKLAENYVYTYTITMFVAHEYTFNQIPIS